MQAETLKTFVVDTLDDLKAEDITVLDVRGRTSIADFMVVCSGTSDRHVKSMASHLVDEAKQQGERPLGVQGEKSGDWVLVDLADVIVHVMQRETRAFYNLERLWSGEEASNDRA